ncbi:hypothetical protein L210DRAFT_3512778 [Boletus edulis BED1]|uniref:Uncharacterized protein n=1 Tax=Boletus edulis BED1 TaxID=1328754 RepID=A0AAD4G4X1_BOLED|nr:hypothetical protein L210DRAFT_3512778 [Boletus edulis BED1]
MNPSLSSSSAPLSLSPSSLSFSRCGVAPPSWSATRPPPAAFNPRCASRRIPPPRLSLRVIDVGWWDSRCVVYSVGVHSAPSLADVSAQHRSGDGKKDHSSSDGYDAERDNAPRMIAGITPRETDTVDSEQVYTVLHVGNTSHHPHPAGSKHETAPAKHWTRAQ